MKKRGRKLKKIEYSRKFLVNPYLATLLLFAIIFTTAVLYFGAIKPIVADLMQIGVWDEIVKTEDFGVLEIFAVILLALYITCYCISDQAFGVLHIKEDCLIMRTPLKRRKKIPYDEIKVIGIDVGTTGAFWIYISRKPIPLKYHHRINLAHKWNYDMLFGYSDKAYYSLRKFLPKKLSDQFGATASILSMYRDK